MIHKLILPPGLAGLAGLAGLGGGLAGLRRLSPPPDWSSGFFVGKAANEEAPSDSHQSRCLRMMSAVLSCRAVRLTVGVDINGNLFMNQMTWINV